MKNHYDYDDIDCKGIRDKENLFNLPIDEDYYKPKKTSSAFDNNYIEYESKENKDKILSIREYLDVIKPHLSNIISNHKTQEEWEI